jgi:hypothetical protein
MSKTVFKSPEEELEELQKRFHLLEGDRKAFYESANFTLR